jgi:hypothetical protein
MRRGQSSESIHGLIKRLQIRALVAKGHKNTNAPLILKNLGYYFFGFGQKKIISRIFKISGALIVICTYVLHTARTWPFF